MLPTWRVLEGHVLDVLRGLPEGSVQTVVTSPPYWGLRAYGTAPQVWGGDPACAHARGDRLPTAKPGPGNLDASATSTLMNPWRNEETRLRGPGAGVVCLHCGAWRGELGLEPTPELYVAHLVEVFREVRRVLRADGTVWLNLGDCYATGAGAVGEHPGGGEQGARWGGDVNRIRDDKRGYRGDRLVDPKARKGIGPMTQPNRMALPGLKAKDRVGIPWLAAFALRADGWWLRAEVVWGKGLSFCPAYSGSVMPESVNGWRWERHRIRVRSAERPTVATWSECPGCADCAPHGGYVLRKGSWRPTTAHEQLFLLAKSADYFCDAEAVREANGDRDTLARYERGRSDDHKWATGGPGGQTLGERLDHMIGKAGRNPRSVWAITPQPFPDAHFATFPEALVEPCVQAATSEKGQCPACGAPWARMVERTPMEFRHSEREAEKRRQGLATALSGAMIAPPRSTTLGWRPTCACPPADPVPQIVLDPFAGSGTVGVVAVKLGRSFVGAELNAGYGVMARKRIGGVAPLLSRAFSR